MLRNYIKPWIYHFIIFKLCSWTKWNLLNQNSTLKFDDDEKSLWRHRIMLRNNCFFCQFQPIGSKLCQTNQLYPSDKMKSHNFNHYVITNLLRNYIKPWICHFIIFKLCSGTKWSLLNNNLTLKQSMQDFKRLNPNTVVYVVTLIHRFFWPLSAVEPWPI